MADHTWNEDLVDAMLRHQIGLLRLSTSVRNSIWEILDATEADIREQIARKLRRNTAGGLTAANLNRMESLLKGLRQTRAKAWKDVNKALVAELTALALAEPEFQAGILNTIFPVELGLILPDVQTLKAIVSQNAFDGQTVKDLLKTVEAADIRRIEQGVRMGMVQGESIPAIGRRILGTISLKGTDGVTAITRQNMTTIVRTAMNGVGAAARLEFQEANVDLVPLKLFMATLDSRTTPVCRKWDGTLHNLLTRKSVRGATRGQTTPVLPLHPGERSLFSPSVNGEVVGERPIRNFTQRQLVREFGKREGIAVKVPKGQTLTSGRDAIPRGHKGAYDAFARARMRELTGQVPAKTTYSQFLKRQPAKFQDDILGPTRGKLFRKGDLGLDKFVDRTGAEIPLRDLAKFHEDAFRAAGLDPASFAA